MGQILDSNQGFIPIAIGPFGELGRKTYGHTNATLASSTEHTSQAILRYGPSSKLALRAPHTSALGEHILRSHGQMTYSPNNYNEDDASVDGLVTSVETLPYNFDVCQLIKQKHGRMFYGGACHSNDCIGTV
eukprot:scaffold9968_cov49-Cyclotella_meneghiniana.AAC.1